MPRRILVTGASGFLGQHCTRALSQAGWEVVALQRRAFDHDHIAATIQCDLLADGDITDTIRDANASHLLHLAWHDDPKDRWGSAKNLDWAAASLRLGRVFAATGGQHMTFGGSCAEYDWSGSDLREDLTPLNPSSLYGAAKASTSRLLLAAQEELNLTVAVARIFFCYGPGEPRGRLLSDLIHGLLSGEPVDCTDGLQERDYMNAADVAGALERIADRNYGGAINVASGDAIPVRTLIETTARYIGQPNLPQFGKLKRSASDPQRLAADVSRLKSLGFSPAYDLEHGIAEMVESIRQDMK